MRSERGSEHRGWRGFAIAVAVHGTLACAAARPPPVVAPPPVEPPPAAPTVRIVPMHLVATAEAPPRSWMAQVDVEVAADGALSWRGERVGRLSGNRALGPNDVELFTSGSEVTWGRRGRQRRGQIIDSGVVLSPSRERMYFDEGGGVVAARPGRPLRWLPLRMQNFDADALDEASMMLLFAITRAQR